jgi:hypothetical protein
MNRAAHRARLIAAAEYRCQGSATHPKCRAEYGRPHPATGHTTVLAVTRDERVLCQRCLAMLGQSRRRARRAKGATADQAQLRTT